MTSAALRHYVDHVLAAYGPGLDASFPACFDWARLCRDAPAMTERASDGRFDASDLGRARDLQVRADALFRFSHLATLAVLTAGDEESPDPESVLAHFTEAPEDEEEERFEILAAEVLGPVEESLGDEDVELDDRGSRAIELLERSWPIVHGLIADSGLVDVADDAEDDDEGSVLEPAMPVLAALARVAAILAALRWMAAYPLPTQEGADA